MLPMTERFWKGLLSHGGRGRAVMTVPREQNCCTQQHPHFDPAHKVSLIRPAAYSSLSGESSFKVFVHLVAAVRSLNHLVGALLPFKPKDRVNRFETRI
jgi:hypothetical protein